MMADPGPTIQPFTPLNSTEPTSAVVPTHCVFSNPHSLGFVQYCSPTLFSYPIFLPFADSRHCLPPSCSELLANGIFAASVENQRPGVSDESGHVQWKTHGRINHPPATTSTLLPRSAAAHW